MSADEREKWNAIYASGEKNERFSGAPAEIIDWLLPRLAGDSLVVDLGAGLLRNARPFAAAGHRVLALDVSEEAFRAAKDVPTSIETRVLDLDDWQPEAGAYDAILAVHYLNRALLPKLEEALRPGGCLAAEIRLALPRLAAAKPAFRLLPGELASLLPELVLMRHSETVDEDGGLGRYLFRRSD